MNRDDALKKIKKCLALSRSANEHEAAAALRQAQALMREHGLREKDVSLADVAEVKVKACSTAANAWELRLLIRQELFMRPHRRHVCRQSTS